jgi:hypothetical protein
MEDFKIGDKCRVIERTRIGLDLEDLEYTVIDIVKGDVQYPIVLSSDTVSWKQFFSKDELIKL